jgi:hypothetical protein
MKKALILFMIMNAGLVGMVGYTQHKYNQLQDAIATAGTRGNTDDAVLSSVFDATNGAIQGIVTGRGTTSLQTTAYTSDAVLSSSFDATNGALQVILSDNSSDIAFINTTSLTAGDLLYYDAANDEWDNTQGNLTITSTGRLGIGITPLYPLHISGNAGISGSLLIATGNYGVFDGNGATYGMRPRNSSDALELRTNGVTRMTINSTGETIFAYGIVPDAVTADPCGSGYPEGAIFYNSTANVLCYCSASNADLKVSDDSACF